MLIGSIDFVVCVCILCEFVILCEGVDGVVLVFFDCYGGSLDGWWCIVGEFVDCGYVMFVIVGGFVVVVLEWMYEFDVVNVFGFVELLVFEFF